MLHQKFLKFTPDYIENKKINLHEKKKKKNFMIT